MSEKTEIEKLEDRVDGKVSWIVFIAFVLVIIGLFTYLANADTGTNNKVDKNEQRFYEYQQKSDERWASVQADMSAIKQALGVRTIKGNVQ